MRTRFIGFIAAALAAIVMTSGTAVTSPDSTSSDVCPVPNPRKVVAPCADSTATMTSATGASTAVSAARECMASRLAPTFFFTRP